MVGSHQHHHNDLPECRMYPSGRISLFLVGDRVPSGFVVSKTLLSAAGDIKTQSRRTIHGSFSARSALVPKQDSYEQLKARVKGNGRQRKKT